MKKIKLFKKIAIGLCALALSVVTVGLPILSSVSPEPVSADAVEYTESVNALDSTSVLDDLGEEYVKKYANQTSGQIQLHSFMEYCYSGKPTVLNTKYGLYLYIYNPSRTEFEERTGWEYNTATLASSYNADGAPAGYSKLRMKNCGHTEGAYDKLFYKFRIIGLEDIVQGLRDMDEQYGFRRYDISEIELRVKGNTTGSKAYAIARTYTYKGYAEGCGSTEESTLVCEQSEMDVLHLEPYATTYRPEGNNGKNAYTQDSLHSVWFSVPNEYVEKYGEMYAVHAMWREAVLKPALVTGNKEAYDAIEEYLGKHLKDFYGDNGELLGSHNESLGYFYAGAYEEGTVAPDLEIVDLDWCIDKIGTSFNAPSKWIENDILWQALMHSMLHTKPGYLVNPLYLMLYTDGNDADYYKTSPSNIKKGMLEATQQIGGATISTNEGAYSSALFNSIGNLEDYDITKDDTAQLLSKTPVKKDFWDKFFNRDTQYKDGAIENEEIYAIHEVTATDLTGSKKAVSDRLYISQSDYDELMSAYATAQTNNETLYLFRFAKSEYFSQEATLFKKTDKGVWFNDEYYWEQVDTNAYFFSETVYLNFDVIDVTFKKGEVKTVIPVVMTPIDIFPESTPPIDTTTDKPEWDWGTLLPGIGGGNNGDDGWLTKLQKIVGYVIAGAVILFVVVIVGVVISKIRNGHMRRETYKNTKPRYKRRK